tara:strand:- start:325 stop:573 length:249 start_codon:yes stop_codon:yes gene_type:complete
MNKELETIIENEFDCLINDLGCLIKQEWVAEAIKEAVTKAFVLGGVSQQRELLLFRKWQEENWNNVYLYEDKFMVDTYLNKK